jgi:hypothetical protein
VYWTELSASLSAEEVQSRRRELVERVRAYLDEMNASPLLLPMMEAVPPEKIRYLTEREIEELGITGEDPVYNERWVSRQAHVIGISSVEYRRRDAKADAKCEAFDDDCRHAIRWNVPVDQYRRAGEIARERCEKLKGEELVKCVQASVRSAATALAR